MCSLVQVLEEHAWVFCVLLSDTDPGVCILRCLSDLGDPVGQLLQAVSRYIQTLNWLRGEVLGVNGEHEGPRVLPFRVHHYTRGGRILMAVLLDRSHFHREREGQMQGMKEEPTHVTGANIHEALEKCSKRTVLCGLRQQQETMGHDWNRQGELKVFIGSEPTASSSSRTGELGSSST